MSYDSTVKVLSQYSPSTLLVLSQNYWLTHSVFETVQLLLHLQSLSPAAGILAAGRQRDCCTVKGEQGHANLAFAIVC